MGHGLANIGSACPKLTSLKIEECNLGLMTTPPAKHPELETLSLAGSRWCGYGWQTGVPFTGSTLLQLDVSFTGTYDGQLISVVSCSTIPPFLVASKGCCKVPA